VIPLESVYWVHCAKHPHWRAPEYVRVSEVSQPGKEVAQKLFTQRLKEYHLKFPSSERLYSGSIDISEAQPQQEQSMAQPKLSPLPPFTGSVHPPGTQQESPEQVSTPHDQTTNLQLPEREPVKSDNDEPWWKRIYHWRGWRWKKL